MPRGKLINEIGNRYGKLVVIKQADSSVYTVHGKQSFHARWFCLCDCGNTCIVFATNLRDKQYPVWHCGCEKMIQEKTGTVYGKWTIISRDFIKKGKNKVFWLCRCSCGRESYVQGTELRNGKSKSCGKCMPYGQAAFHNLYNRMIKSAKEREIEWDLSEQDVKILTSQPCFYCGEKPRQIAGTHNDNGTYIYNGLDRIDSSKGYKIENVVPCCKDCNYAKRTMSVDRFKSWIISVYEHFVK